MLAVPAEDRGAWRAVAIACLAAFVVALDIAWFDASVASLQILIPLGSLETTVALVAYIGAGALALMAGGALVDAYGWRQVMRVASLAVAVNMVLNATSIQPVMTILGRVLGGAGGSLLIVAGLAAVAKEFADSDRTRPYALIGIATAAAYLFAPALSGFLIEQPYWRVTPVIIGPPLALLVFLLATTTGGAGVGSRGKLDVRGLTSASLTTGAAVAGASLLTRDGADVVSIGLVAATAGLGALFITVERQVARSHRVPVIDITLFRNGTFAAAVGASALGGVGLAAMFLVIVQLSQDIEGFSALETQLAFLPAVLVTIAADVLSPRFDRRLGTGRTIAIGLAVACVGYLVLMSASAAVRFRAFVAAAIVAFGTELTLAPTNRAIVGCADRDAEGTAVSTAKTVYKLSAVVSLALVSGLFFSRFDAMLSSDLPQDAGEGSSINTPAEARQAIDDPASERQSEEVQAASAEAFLDAQRIAFAIPLVAAAAGSAVAWRWIRAEAPSGSRRRDQDDRPFRSPS